MKRTILTIITTFLGIFAFAQNGGITPEVLQRISQGYQGNAADKALKNALAGNSINVLATNSDNAAMIAVAGHFKFIKKDFCSFSDVPFARVTV